MIAACCAVFALIVVGDGSVLEALALSGVDAAPVAAVHLFSSVFVHFSLVHLLGNMYFLYAFGRLLEDRLGTPAFVASFMTFGVMANLAYLAVHADQEGMAGGASGAIAGILGCYLVLFPLRMVGVSVFFTVLRVPAVIYLGLWFVLQVVSMPYQEVGIAYSAHAGGFLAGVLAGAAVRSNLFRRPVPFAR